MEKVEDKQPDGRAEGKILRITKHGEKVLRQRCKTVPFEQIAKLLPEILGDMWATMRAANGVGLAAPQIGLPLRLAIIDVKPGGKSKKWVLINPEIVEKSGAEESEEGCLSIPGLYAKLRRSSRVKVKALNEHGLPVEITGLGLFARALQHETDHLNGKLFVDRLPLLMRWKASRIIRRLKKNWT
ncbi:MAG: peptide deformylase [Elusimicrobia bacterium]|nr:peptide deformylase [Elusimicrobiota bacterium]